MRKSTFKPLVLSALSALALAGVGVGATFALFTDKAEASIDVEAGRVQVGTNASIYKVFEYNGTAAGLEVLPTATDDYTNSIGGTTKKDAQGIFQLKNWAPGDRAQISVEATNSSNVKIKVRLKAVLTGELADALVVKIGNAEFTSVQLAAQGNRTLVTDWTELNPGSNPGDLGIEVSFPNVGTEITAREEGENNRHQGQAASLLVTYEAVQGNADVATTLQEKANSILATNAVLDERNATFSEALGDLPELKADLLSSGLVYGIEEDQFYQTSEVPSGKEYKYFKPASALDSSGYSIYAKSDWATNNVNLVGIGFDAGDAVHIDTISYVGALEARTNYIVTNSLDTAITVNAPQDTIYHYGDAASVNVIAAANQSYHEFGYVPFLQVANGRVALEKDSKVDKLHFNYDAVNEKFDEIVVAYEPSVTLPAFSRDEVENIGDEGKLVVELQNHVEKDKAESDYVWLYHQGLKEQIRISDSADEAGEVKSTDEQVAANTAKLAEDIANTLQSGYEPTTEQIESGTVDTTKVEEKGLDEEEKAEVAEEAVETAIEEKFDGDEMSDYVCRIGAVGYMTLQAAANDIPVGVEKTIVLLADTSEQLMVLANNQRAIFDMNGHTASFASTSTTRGILRNVEGTPYRWSNGMISLNPGSSLLIKNGTLSVGFGDVGGYNRGAIVNHGGSLILEDMTITSENRYSASFTVDNLYDTQDPTALGELKIRGNTTISADKGSALENGAGYNTVIDDLGTNGNITIISNAAHAISNGAGAKPGPTLVVNGHNTQIKTLGDRKNAVDNYGTVTINDGTVTGGPASGTTPSCVVNNHSSGGSYPDATVIFNGGTINAGEGAYAHIISQSVGTNIYNGGTFNRDPWALDQDRTQAEFDAHVQINGYVNHDELAGTWTIAQQVWDWYVTPDGTNNYKVDNFNNHVDVSESWTEILGSGDHPETWKLNEDTGLYEESESLGLAKRGDTVHFANGVYTISGKIYTPDGVTIMGESKAGTIIECSEGVHAHGDLTVKNLTFGTQVGGGNYWIVRPNTAGLNSDTNPTAEDILKSADYDFYFEDVVFNYYQASQRNYGPYQAAHGDLTIKNCEFVNLRNAICGLSCDGNNHIVITGNTFTNIRTEVIGFNESEYLNADVVAQWYANNTFDEVSDGKIVGYGPNSEQTVYPHN